MQTKRHSLLESVTNVAVGFIISLLATFIIFPIAGVESSFAQNLEITLYYTIIAIVRNYVIRRFFNKKV